jgi:hypothetical protein
MAKLLAWHDNEWPPSCRLVVLAVASRKTIDPSGEMWRRVLEATGQPAVMLATGVR